MAKKEIEAEKKKPGLKPGQTNNPNGRPKGSKNVVSAEIKEKIAGYLNNNFETFEADLGKLNKKPHIRAKLFIEAAKLIIPRPVSDEEQDNFNKLYGGLAHLFGKKEEE